MSSFTGSTDMFGAKFKNGVMCDPVVIIAKMSGLKTRVLGLSYGVICVIVRLATLVQCRLVTDRRTDGQTDGHTTTVCTALA